MIFVNFKTYQEGTGASALALISVLEKVAKESGIKIIPVVQAADVKEAVSASKLEIWVQKIDPAEFGAHTGATLAEAVKEDGALGTFLNHSENKFQKFEDLKEANSRALAVGLKTLIFAGDMQELSRVLTLKSTLVAYEPPELVGSKTTSVTQAQPQIISQAADLAKAAGIPLVVGAGIKSSLDVKKSLELGAVGVAVASDVVTAENPGKETADLVEGFK
jgi:triosephosphate isomerase